VSAAADDRLVAVLLRSDAAGHAQLAEALELDGDELGMAGAHRRAAEYLYRLALGFTELADDDQAPA
jgi:hypothetical protein